MNRVFVFSLALLFAAGMVRAKAEGATVTEAVNEVGYGKSGSAHSTPAPVGTVLGDGEYVKTGAGSRAELQFHDQTVTRLGADTIFNYSSASNEVDLQSGTILFSKKKDGRELEIKTAAVTAAIVGTTGFAQVQVHNHQTHYIFGIIEGKALADGGGKHFTIHAGEILLLSPGSPPILLTFDLPRLVRTSPLIIKFNKPLPNLPFIEKAIAQYEADVSRGFILPSNGTYTTDIYSVDIPAVPTVARDSAGNQLHNTTQPTAPSNPGSPNPGTPRNPGYPGPP